MSRFAYYYRYERIFHNESVNKYELLACVGEYPEFNDHSEIKAFQAILFQSERIAMYKNKKQGVHTLSVLVPWEKGEKIGVLNLGHDTMVVIASPGYQTVEIFVACHCKISQTELLKHLKTGDFEVELKTLRDEADFVS